MTDSGAKTIIIQPICRLCKHPRSEHKARGCIHNAKDGYCGCQNFIPDSRIPSPTYALTQTDLHAKVMEVLPKPHQDILTYVIGCYPSMVSKETLSEQVGRRGGAFNNPLGRLRTLGLIDYPEKGYVKAESFLFME